MLGIDVGVSSIKVVELTKDSSAWELIAAGIAPTPPPGLVSDLPRDLTSVSQALGKLLAEAKITEKNVVLSLPEEKVYTRLVSFPPLSDQEIASAVGWQIEGYIPISKKDAIYDHQIVGKSDRGVEVLIIAAPKMVVQKYMKVLELANLVPAAIETELLALSRSVAPPKKRSLVIDFGATSTDIAVVVDNKLMFSRSVGTAGQALTRALARGIGVEEIRAEEYKKTYGLTEDKLEGKIKEILSPLILGIVDEIKKAMGYWRQDHENLIIESVILCGGTTALPALSPILAASLGIEVTIGNPFWNVKIPENNKKSLSPFAHLYGVAVGLAMREK